MNETVRKDAIRIFVFFFLIILLTSISYVVRDFLTANYNNLDFLIFSIDYVKNTGAAFSLLETHTTLLIVLSVVILSIFLGLIITNIKRIKNSDLILYSFLLAGVFGNLIERILDGFVTDYIRLNFVTFPVFNLSDAFINVGAFLIICNILFINDKQDKQEKPDRQDN